MERRVQRHLPPALTMRISLKFALFSLVLACAEPETAEPRGQEEDASGKIDAQLQSAATGTSRVGVLILLRDQLLLGPDALATFASANANANRLVLRGTVVAQLRALSDAGAARIAGALPSGANPHTLWILNGVVAQLTQPEILSVARERSVLRLYLLPRVATPDVPVPASVVTPVRTPFDPAGKNIPWNIADIGAPAAWQRGVTGENAVIALIDERVRIDHPDLRNNIWVNEDEVPNNFVDDDGNGLIDDRHGYNFSEGSAEIGSPRGPHGTYTSGIAVGDGSGGTITGVAPRARVMPLVGIAFVEVARALQYALENGADVVNMSFSVSNQLNLRGPWRLISDHATAAGLVLVSGAGNFRQSQPVPVQLRTPEDIPSVIAVGGLTQSLRLAEFSSTGPVEWGSIVHYGDFAMPAGLIKPDVVAFPGAGYPVLSLAGNYIDPNTEIRGNSFSSPHVAGAAALLLSDRPTTPAWRIRQILEETARDLDTPGKDNRTGFGLIDVAAALTRLRQ